MEPKYYVEKVIGNPNHHFRDDWIPRVICKWSMLATLIIPTLHDFPSARLVVIASCSRPTRAFFWLNWMMCLACPEPWGWFLLGWTHGSYELDMRLSCFKLQSKVVKQHTELEHTPSNLYQRAMIRDSFHSWRCRGIARGVRFRGVL